MSMLDTSRHKITTHNLIAFAYCSKPLSDRTPGELRPDMITCFSMGKSVMSADGLLNQGGEDVHVERLAEPIERTVD